MGSEADRRVPAESGPAPVHVAAADRAHVRTRMERERIIVRLRGVVLLFTVVQSLIQAGDHPALTWIVAGVLVVDWAVTRHLVGRESLRHHVLAGWIGMVADTVLVGLTLANTRQDVADPTYLIVLFLSLEAALRWGRWGGIAGGLVAGSMASVWGWSVISAGGRDPLSYSTLRFFVIAIVGGITGDLVHRLNSERRRLAEMAYADPLTGLANRSAFQESVEVELARHTAPALVYLDLDGFKAVNDRLGHTVGDAVLVAVADRLRATVRADDIVARLGGDEFVVLVCGEARRRLDDLVQRLHDAVVEPIAAGDREIVVGVSCGGVLARGVDDVDTLLRRADDAMYTAKRAGRSTAGG